MERWVSVGLETTIILGEVLKNRDSTVLYAGRLNSAVKFKRDASLGSTPPVNIKSGCLKNALECDKILSE